jgi:hypothetical protein
MSKLKFELDAQVLQIINKGLMLLPYGEAAPVVNILNAQIQQQFDAAIDNNLNASDKKTKKNN